MFKKLFYHFCIAIVLCFNIISYADSLITHHELCKDGKANYRIVIAEDAYIVTETAAKVLQKNLGIVTGQEFPIDRQAGNLSVPTNSIFIDDGLLAENLGVNLVAEGVRYDGFIVRSVGERIVLAGATERGPIYAVMDFLEREVGCRWYSPERRIIPHQENLTVNVTDRREEPAFRVRLMPTLDFWLPDTDPRKIDREWMMAARSTYSQNEWGKDALPVDYGIHNYYSVVPPSRFFNEHPDWYSCQSSIWFEGQLNYHNKKLIKYIKNYIIKFLRDRPDLKHYTFGPRDWIYWSEDPNTNAFDAREGTVAASHVCFTNQFAGEMAKYFPDKKLTTIAYFHTLLPPKTLRYLPNVSIWLCTPWGLRASKSNSGIFGEHYFDMIRTWTQKCDEIIIWDYVRGTGVYRFMPPDEGVIKDLQRYKEMGIKGVWLEGDGKRLAGSPFDDLRPYAYYRLMWDPYLDYESLLRDFNYGYYGEAAGEKMLEFYRMVCEGMKKFPYLMGAGNEHMVSFPDKYIDKLEAVLTEAHALAEDDFSRRKIEQASLGLIRHKLVNLTKDYCLENGYMKNAGDTADVQRLKKEFNDLSEKLGESAREEPNDRVLNSKAYLLANKDIKVVVVPEEGGGVVSIVDRKDGKDYAYLEPFTGTVVGAYQELPLTYGVAYETKSYSDKAITMYAETEDSWRQERTVKVENGSAFTIHSILTNISDQTKSAVIQTRPSLTVGDLEHCIFVYRSQDGKIHWEPVRDLSVCRSSGWGPTGMWAVLNTKTNRGILWETSCSHNATWFQGYPMAQSFLCEMISERKTLAPEQSLEVTQSFTIIRDVRRWRKNNNVKYNEAKVCIWQ